MTNAQSPVPGPWTPERVRMLKIAVTIMTTLLIAGIIALLYGVARQAAKLSSGPASATRPALSSPAAAPATTPYAQTLALGQGELRSVSADNGSIILHYKGEGSDTIIVLDPLSGQERGRFQVPRR